MNWDAHAAACAGRFLRQRRLKASETRNVARAWQLFTPSLPGKVQRKGEPRAAVEAVAASMLGNPQGTERRASCDPLNPGTPEGGLVVAFGGSWVSVTCRSGLIMRIPDYGIGKLGG